jgi:hypothetical protein
MYFISNKLKWQAAGITRIRRHRWPVEVYHEEGKADGLDQYQVRDFEAISRHISLVAVTYSLLRVAQHDEALLHKLQRHVQTQLDGSAGSWRRHTQAQALWTLAVFIATGLSQGQALHDVMEPLLAMLHTETCRSAFQDHGSAWLGDIQAKVGETFGLSLIQTD